MIAREIIHATVSGDDFTSPYRGEAEKQQRILDALNARIAELQARRPR